MKYGIKYFLLSSTLLLSILSYSAAVYAGSYINFLNAARNGNSGRVRTLLNENINVNIRNEKGMTALMYAAANGQKEVMKTLLAEGAKINVKNIHGMTALMYAAFNGQKETVKMLLAEGADAGIKNNYGYTAFMLAEEGEHYQVLNLFGTEKIEKELK